MEIYQSPSNLMSRCEHFRKGVPCNKPVAQDSYFCTEHTNRCHTEYCVMAKQWRTLADQLMRF